MSTPKRLVFSLLNEEGYVDGSKFTDGDLASVPPDTVFLKLECSSIGDPGIESLPALRRLRCIDLDSTEITDRSMNWLSRCESLEEIWIEDTAVTEAGLLKLSRIAGLKYISVSYCDITQDDLKRLRKSFPGTEIDG